METIKDVLDEMEARGEDYLTVGDPAGEKALMVAVKPDKFAAIYDGYPLDPETGQVRPDALVKLDQAVEEVRWRAK